MEANLQAKIRGHEYVFGPRKVARIWNNQACVTIPTKLGKKLLGKLVLVHLIVLEEN